MITFRSCLIAAFEGGTEAAKRGKPVLPKNVAKYFVNQRTDNLNKIFTPSEGSRTVLTKNKMKYAIKVIKSVENREILFKGTTKKVVTK